MTQQYESTLSSLSDPRLDRRFFSTAGDILLVGVLHDHPASIARVETVIDAVEPETVALEVPPLALPYYSQCAGAGAIAGGERSAASAAAPTATPVGIDLPSLSGLPELGRQLLDSTSLATAKRLVSRFTSVLAEVGRCRVAAVRGNLTAGDQPIEYDCEGSPRAQAEHELSSLRQSERVFAAMERSGAMVAFDALQERHMAKRLTALESSGGVVAVVGYAHLDVIAERLGEDAQQSTRRRRVKNNAELHADRS
jgi:hypothetical protein